MRVLRGWFLCAVVLALACSAHAGTPRWVAGPTWWNATKIMNWYTTGVTYWVDPGSLSTYVNHTAAVAMVDAAAAVWNVPNGGVTLTDGGTLAEDVSGASVYLGSNGPIWPADVASTSYLTRPIAVVFDADGTITDMLLGQGASDPENCLQAGVTESVDLFIQPGNVAHAVIILNGRCTGPGTAPQLQMQYQLMRAFGHVLGVGWSQLNENVFTGATPPTYQQQMHWPIMHPIDIICGQYTYQCLPQPFTLRPDDISSLQRVYATNGAQSKFPGTAAISARLVFPTGEGMNGVNITAVRYVSLNSWLLEGWETQSAVSGIYFTGESGNSVTGPVVDPSDSHGFKADSLAGQYEMVALPIATMPLWMTVYMTGETINPLYTGAYSVGPYRTGPVTPSSQYNGVQWVLGSGQLAAFGNVTVAGAASVCSTPTDGPEWAPAAVVSTGEWSSQFCAYGHTAWLSLPVQQGHTASIEVTATDESGNASSQKAMPLVAVWHGTDPIGTRPTMAAVSAPFNGRQNGSTVLPVSFTATETVRVGIVEQRGEGRPDFGYHARVLYAASVSPSTLPATGGAVRIFGMGFEPGNSVTIGGLAATVISISPTEIDAAVSSLPSSSNDVTVTDIRTGGTSTIAGGVGYGGTAGATLSIVSAPAGTAAVGQPVTLTVKLTNSNGTAIVNGVVTFTSPLGSVVYQECGQASCTLFTDANGMASVQAAAQVAGPVVLQAGCASGSTVQAAFTTVAAVQSITAVRAVEYVAAGSSAPFAPEVSLTLNGLLAPNQSIAWLSPSPDVALRRTDTVTSADGTSNVPAVAHLYGGEQLSLRACAWSNICTLLPLTGVSATDLSIVVLNGGTQVVSASGNLSPVSVRVLDRAGHGVAGATISVHQVVQQWAAPCPSSGRCPTPAVYGSGDTTAVTDDDGMVSITPLQYTGAATVTEITACVGNSGVVSATLQKTP